LQQIGVANRIANGFANGKENEFKQHFDMAQFKIGDPVVKIDSDAHGTIIAVKSGRVRVIYTVVLGDGTQSTVLEPDLHTFFYLH